jgi:hypothetical protein
LMGLDDDENDEGRSRAMIIIKKTSPLKKWFRVTVTFPVLAVVSCQCK